jgi:hypothetical protein
MAFRRLYYSIVDSTHESEDTMRYGFCGVPNATVAAESLCKAGSVSLFEKLLTLYSV